MNQYNLPTPQQVTQTVAKSRHHRRELELASIELEELIVQLEQDNRQRRSKYLVNLSSKSA
ncbi:hypothetical protein I4641_13870 [Waterburya agarophytonicola K14]|uniref:Uncharacterized protein n=1 Tax=Waterburya agarophytonicola KI4 TaxID=2874699 RepID=A0A964BR10_9CYAN|nr:hypothetical protein [Waterburya agarophytonicola]MCC0178068.1 hypothetical protein [Waterburya agarophytonicola KI4]